MTFTPEPNEYERLYCEVGDSYHDAIFELAKKVKGDEHGKD